MWGSALPAATIAQLGGGADPSGSGAGPSGSGAGPSSSGTGAGSAGTPGLPGDPPVSVHTGGHGGRGMRLRALWRLRLSPYRLMLSAASAHRRARRTAIHASYWASDPSRTRLTLQVRRNGHMTGTRCRADSRMRPRPRRAGAACWWWATVLAVTHHDRPRVNHVTIRPRRRRLTAGMYRVLATPRFAGRTGLTRAARLAMIARGVGPRSTARAHGR